MLVSLRCGKETRGRSGRWEVSREAVGWGWEWQTPQRASWAFTRTLTFALSEAGSHRRALS